MSKPLNISEGTKFGQWVVLSTLPKSSKHGYSMFLCQCSCGREIPVKGTSLVQGLSTKCRNVHFDKVYGSWTVLNVTKSGAGINTMVLCRCACGNEKEVNLNSLKRNDTKSCILLVVLLRMLNEIFY